MPIFTFMLRHREFGCYAEFSPPPSGGKLKLDNFFYSGFEVPLDDAAGHDFAEAANAADSQCFRLVDPIADHKGNTSLTISEGVAAYTAKTDRHRLAHGDVTVTFVLDAESEDKTHVLVNRLVAAAIDVIRQHFPKPEPEEG